VAETTNKYTKRNVLGGLIVACVGGAVLAISGYDIMLSSSYAHDIHQEFCDYTGCRAMEDITRDAAISAGIFGTILTAVGLFFFIYGLKHESTKGTNSVQ